MQDTLILDFKAPDRCVDCWFMNTEDSWCCAMKGRHLSPEYKYGTNGKPSWCPCIAIKNTWYKVGFSFQVVEQDGDGDGA